MLYKMRKSISVIILMAFFFSTSIAPIAYANERLNISLEEFETLNENEGETQNIDSPSISSEESIAVTENEGSMQIQASGNWLGAMIELILWLLSPLRDEAYNYVKNSLSKNGNVIDKIINYTDYTKIEGRMIKPSNGNIAKGSTRTEDVKAIQTRLKNLGYYTMAIDGDFGPGTESAVKSFQANHTWTPDGIVGPLTFRQLGWCDHPKSYGLHLPHIR